MSARFDGSLHFFLVSTAGEKTQQCYFSTCQFKVSIHYHQKAVVLGAALALGHVSFDVLEVAWMEKMRP